MTLRSALAAAAVSLTCSAAALTLALPSPANAAMPGPVAVAAVPTADLDLASAHGQAVLKHRLRQAAVEVCGDASSADPASRRWVRTCRADAFARAWDRAQANLDRPARLVAR